MFSVALLLLFTAGSRVQCEQLTQPSSKTLQPGERLTIPCQVSYSVSSYYTSWIRQPAGGTLEWIGDRYTGDSNYKASLKSKFRIDADSSRNTVTLNGENMQPGDSAVYYCARGVYGYMGAFAYWGQGTTVTVTSATITPPTVFPLLPCDTAGDTVTLSCLATGFTPSALTFGWTNGDTAITDIIQYPAVQDGNHFTGISQVKVSKQDWDSKNYFYCKTTHNGKEGDMSSFKKKEVFNKLPTLKLMASSREPLFACFANDFSPNTFKFKWLKDDREIPSKTSEITTTSAGKDSDNGKLYSAVSFLTVERSELTDNAKFTCVFEGIAEPVNTSVTHEPMIPKEKCPDPTQEPVTIRILDPTPEDLLFHKNGTLTCDVDIKKSGVKQISWRDVVDEPLIVDENFTGKKSHEVQVTASEWTNGFTRTCVVQLSDREMTKEYKRPPGKQSRPAVYMLAPVEQNEIGSVTLTCFVKDFFPEDIIITWLVNDVPVQSTNYRSSTTKPVLDNGSYMAYSHLTFANDLWKNGMEYSCVVYHESVDNNTKAIVRSMASRSFDKFNLVNLNMNLPQCKAQ